MSHKRRGLIVLSGEWAKHLRKWGRRKFWKQHRRAEKSFAQELAAKRDLLDYIKGGR